MKTDDHNKVTEAGFFSLSGWRRDSARRLPLRQTAPSIGRELSPQYAREAGDKSERPWESHAAGRLTTCRSCSVVR